MFMHIFGYRLKCLARDKEQVFWTLLFPLLMATMFFFAFGHLIGEQESFSPIKTAVIDNMAYKQNAAFRQVLDDVSMPGEKRLLELVVVPQEQAEELLAEGDVDGIITVGETIGLMVKSSGLNQSILKLFLDECSQTASTFSNILEQNPVAAGELPRQLAARHSYIESASFSDAPPDTMLNYFYALIAMTCFYSSYWGLRNAIDTQADLSDQGARRSVAPTHKLQVVIYEAAAALAVSLAEVLLLLVYLALPCGVSFGNQLGYILLTCLVGCVAGVSFGACIGTLFRKSEGVKRAILTAVTLGLSFLAGLMYANMRDIVARKAPVLSYINPVALITDALYSLYVFDDHTRFFINIGMLCLISAVFCTVSFLRLRGEKYASL